MTQQSAYIKYRASEELDRLVVLYINEMAKPDGKPDLDILLRIMDLFVAESINTFIIVPADQLNLKPGMQKMIHSLVNMVEKSASMLIGKVAKGMKLEDHRNAAGYMASVRQVEIIDGEEVGLISFPVDNQVAQLGWHVGEKILSEGASDPEIVAEGAAFLHEVTNIANLWIFEKPVGILNLGRILKALATTTVSGVQKVAHALIDKLVPHMEEEQITVAADYFSDIVRFGPFLEEVGAVPANGRDALNEARDARRATA